MLVTALSRSGFPIASMRLSLCQYSNDKEHNKRVILERRRSCSDVHTPWDPARFLRHWWQHEILFVPVHFIPQPFVRATLPVILLLDKGPRPLSNLLRISSLVLFFLISFSAERLFCVSSSRFYRLVLNFYFFDVVVGMVGSNVRLISFLYVAYFWAYDL